MRYNSAMRTWLRRFKFPARRVWRALATLLVLLLVLVQEYPAYGIEESRLARAARRAFDFGRGSWPPYRSSCGANTAGTQAWLSGRAPRPGGGYFQLLGEIEQVDRDLKDYYTHAGAQPDPARREPRQSRPAAARAGQHRWSRASSKSRSARC
jgi:hypothetical protein